MFIFLVSYFFLFRRSTLKSKLIFSPPYLPSLQSLEALGKQLLIAAQNGSLEGLHASLDAGAPVDFCNEDQETALHLAAEKGHLQIVEALILRKANVNALNEANSTPLHYAAASTSKHFYKEIISSLLKAGAISKSNELTFSALECVEEDEDFDSFFSRKQIFSSLLQDYNNTIPLQNKRHYSAIADETEDEPPIQSLLKARFKNLIKKNRIPEGKANDEMTLPSIRPINLFSSSFQEAKQEEISLQKAYFKKPDPVSGKKASSKEKIPSQQ